MSEHHFEIIETRDYSLRLEAEDGTKFWIKAKWYNEHDGTFTEEATDAYLEQQEKDETGKEMVPLPSYFELGELRRLWGLTTLSHSATPCSGVSGSFSPSQ